MKKLVILLCIGVLVFGLIGCSGSSGSTTSAQETMSDEVAENSSSAVSDAVEMETEAMEDADLQENADTLANENILMSVRLDNGKVSEYVFNNESLELDQIVSIIFLDSLSDMKDTAWDVSASEDGSVMAWVEAIAGDSYALYIAGDGGVCANTDSSFLFSNYENVETIEFNDCFYTGEATDISGMFMGCKSLAELDVRSFNTANVTDMSSLFYKCSSLTSLDLSSFNTTKVTDMSSMFVQCSSLTELNVSSFDTSNVTDVSSMFSECGISALDLSSFDTTSVTSMISMFYGCGNLTDLDISSFDMTNANTAAMFSGTIYEE